MRRAALAQLRERPCLSVGPPLFHGDKTGSCACMTLEDTDGRAAADVITESGMNSFPGSI